jgi:hypothetical protein
MLEYLCSIRSNLIIKSIIVLCKIISRLTDVGRTVKTDVSDTRNSGFEETFPT